MTTTLPTPSHGLEYTNSATGDKFKYDSDAGAWVGFEGIDESGDSMTGTIAYPDMLINGNTLTADFSDAGEGLTFSTEESIDGWYYRGLANVWQTWGLCNKTIDGYYLLAYYDAIYRSEDLVNWVEVSPQITTGPDSKHSSTRISKIVTANGSDFLFGASNATSYFYSKDDYRGDLGPFFRSVGSSTRYIYETGGFDRVKDNQKIAYMQMQTDEMMVSIDGNNQLVKTVHNARQFFLHNDKYWAISRDVSQGHAYSENFTNWSKVSSEQKIDTGVRADLFESSARLITHRANSNGQYILGSVMSQYQPDPSKYLYRNQIQFVKSYDGLNWEYLSMPSVLNQSTTRAAYYGHNIEKITWVEDEWIIDTTYEESGIKKKEVFSSKDGITWQLLDLASLFSSSQLKHTSSSMHIVDLGGGRTEYITVDGDKNVFSKIVEGDGSADNTTDSKLYFNGDPVVVDKGQTRALAQSVSGLSSLLGSSRYYQAEEPSDSFGIDNGTLWLNPSNAKLSIYYDSDWNQLN